MGGAGYEEPDPEGNCVADDPEDDGLMGEMERRRRYPRIPSQNSVLVKRLGDDVLEGFTRTRVVGLGGCMFVSDEPLGVGSFMDVLISVRGSVAKALSKVVYECQVAEGEYEIGVEFILISDVDRRLLAVLWCSDKPVKHFESSLVN